MGRCRNARFNLRSRPRNARLVHDRWHGKGNNSCGTHALYAGKTVDNIDGLSILTYDGTRLEVGSCGDDELALAARQNSAKGRVYA